jgi:cyclopropane fatty-acyl-phospholipid synthase-like methyltransferase
VSGARRGAAQDYRNVHGSFDAVVSVKDVPEHIGVAQLPLVHGGGSSVPEERTVLLHTVEDEPSETHRIPFFEASVSELGLSYLRYSSSGDAMENLFVLEDIHRAGLRADAITWWKNFEAGYPTLDQAVRSAFLADVAVLFARRGGRGGSARGPSSGSW